MIFGAPLPFSEALQRREVQSILPTSLSTAEIEARLQTEFTERALFSARTLNSEYLQEIGSVIDSILDPQQVVGGDRTVTAGMDVATARLALKTKLDEIGYTPSEEDRGTIGKACRRLSEHLGQRHLGIGQGGGDAGIVLGDPDSFHAAHAQPVSRSS